MRERAASVGRSVCRAAPIRDSGVDVASEGSRSGWAKRGERRAEAEGSDDEEEKGGETSDAESADVGRHGGKEEGRAARHR